MRGGGRGHTAEGLRRHGGGMSMSMGRCLHCRSDRGCDRRRGHRSCRGGGGGIEPSMRRRFTGFVRTAGPLQRACSRSVAAAVLKSSSPGAFGASVGRRCDDCGCAVAAADSHRGGRRSRCVLFQYLGEGSFRRQDHSFVGKGVRLSGLRGLASLMS